MSEQLANPAVTVNNDIIEIIPNSLSFTEGLGEQTTRAVSGGGGNVSQVYSDNVETNMGMVKFEIPPTVANIALAREWKTSKNQNLIQVSGRTADGVLTRSFAHAALLGDYEVPLGSDTNIALEFKTDAAI